MRVTQMEKEALQRTNLLVEEKGKDITDSEINRLTFNQSFYSKLAACSTGDVPTEEEAYLMPSVEREKWYAAVRNVNPQWFVAIDALVKKVEDAEAAEEKKRKKQIASLKN